MFNIELSSSYSYVCGGTLYVIASFASGIRDRNVSFSTLLNVYAQTYIHTFYIVIVFFSSEFESNAVFEGRHLLLTVINNVVSIIWYDSIQLQSIISKRKYFT